MSERLEEIKDHYIPYDENFGLDSNDLEWLIEQAERVGELEEQVNNKRIAFMVTVEELVKFAKRNDCYREELESVLSYDHIEKNIPNDVIESINKALEESE